MNGKRSFIPYYLLAAFLIGQAVSYTTAPGSWQAFVGILPRIVSMIAFWGPIVAIFSAVFVWMMLRLLGFNSLEALRIESVEENNPAPAIIFTGTLIASILFLSIVIRP